MKPILFNTEMVQAIMEGRKIVTRRVIKPQPNNIEMLNGVFSSGLLKIFYDFDKEINIKAPYEVGDILYVRETWCYHKTGNWYGYRADGDYRDLDLRWKPSIHMPKEAARIFLKVTDVRVEKLQEITDKEAEKEGIKAETNNSGKMHLYTFISLWNSTIKPKDLDKYGWKTNPWVWVIDFEGVER